MEESYLIRNGLRAPFPWFGGKSRAASIVWDHFGNVPNYVEPFAGSLAVLLGRPHPPGTETVNDIDCYLANFWRAVRSAPLETAQHADWPVNEADMLARHKWMLAQNDFRDRMRVDPDYYDAKIAGWWAWGCNVWIGDGWCEHEYHKLPHLGNPGKGVHRRLPHLGDPGTGVHRRLPHLGDPGTGVRLAAITGWFDALAIRLRDVRVCCGEWSRVLGESVTTKHGVTGLFLDPPYGTDHAITYSGGDDQKDTSTAVRDWAIENGGNQMLRIALCGYEGEHDMPPEWECVHWRARKGYQSVNDDGTHGGHLERIWFSPACLKQPTLFSAEDLLT